jgi:hypothetical protein
MTFQLSDEYCWNSVGRSQKHPKAHQNKYFMWRKGYRGRSSTWNRLKSCLQGDNSDILVVGGGNRQWPARQRQRQDYSHTSCEVCDRPCDCPMSYCGYPGRIRNPAFGRRHQECGLQEDMYCNGGRFMHKEPQAFEQDWCDCPECTDSLRCDICRLSSVHCTRWC